MSKLAEPLSCAEVAGLLPRIVDEPGAAPEPVITHVQICLSCQAELARGRKMLAMLGALRNDPVALPAGFLSELVLAVEQAGHRRAIRSILSGHKVAYLAGLGLGLGATGAIVLVARASSSRAVRTGQTGAESPYA